MFTDDSRAVRDDEVRSASLSIHFACLGCHNDDPDDNALDKTLEQAVAAATGMHWPVSVKELNEFKIGVYPNPVVENVTIRFNLSKPANATLEIFNAIGQLVYSISDVNKPAGNQYFNWNGTGNSGAGVESGIYYVKVSANNASSMEKLILIK